MWWLLGAAVAATVELPEGDVLSSFRVRGMGGACAALAESATCQLRQPASVGVRRPEDDNAWGADTTIQAPRHPVLTRLFGGEDDPAPSLRTKWQVGSNLKMNRFAAGVHLRQDAYNGPDGAYTASQWGALAGVSGSAWSVGGAPVLVTWQTPEGGVGAGLGGVVGGLWAPDRSPLRVGLTGRAPVRTQSLSGRAWDSTRLPGRVSVGLGYGFEVGANTFGGHVKYSALDERRHEGAPLSVALTGQLGLRYAGGGLLVSKQLDAGAMQVRPVVNVWYQSHYLPVSWAMPEDMTDAEDPIENPGVTDDDSEGELGTGLYATVGMQEVYIPIGVELPIALNDDWDLVPFAAYALSIPVDSWSTNILCYDCFAGLEDISLARRSHLWVGVKFQPPLRRPGAPTTEESP